MQTKIIPLISQEALQKRVEELGQNIAQEHPTEGIRLMLMNESEQRFVQDLKHSIGSRAKIVRSGDEFEDNEKLCILLVKYLIESEERLDQMRNKIHLDEQKNVSIFSVCLLQRITPNKIVQEPDYLGFSIPNECVVGYGKGIQGEYDSLPHIAIYDAS